MVLLGLLGLGIVYCVVSSLRRILAARRSGRRPASENPLKFGRANVALFVGPALLLYSVFVILPCVKSFSWSTHRWNGLGDMAYTGLLHFKRITVGETINARKFSLDLVGYNGIIDRNR